MLNPSIFISHSAKDKSSKALLEELYAALNKNFDVLLDKERLKPGVDWRLELFGWLRRCDSAVILFSQDALKSRWVLQEATILNWRCSYEKNFSIVPILLSPVTPDDLKEGWFSAIALDRLQAIRNGKGKGIVRKVAGELKDNQSRRDKDNRASSGESIDKATDQVAAICCKKEGRQIKFLLIRARNKNNIERWIFPKGWIHRREPLWLSAQLEARKEAGVAGIVTQNSFTTFKFREKKDETLMVKSFILKVDAEFDPIQEDRDPSWYSLSEAQEKVLINRETGRRLKNARELQLVLERAYKDLSYEWK